MTPEEYIRPHVFTTVESTRWPPKPWSRFAQWFRHRDGRIVFYIRGTVEGGTYKGNLGDHERREAFKTEDACHYCVCCTGYGRLEEYGTYSPRFGTTERKFDELPWGSLCRPCRLSLAADAKAKYLKRLRNLGVTEGEIVTPPPAAKE